MALNPLSTELNRTGYGYWVSTGHGRTAKRQLISHPLYMDDLKLYGRNPDQLDGLLHTVRTFSDDIRMKFGLEKCAVAHFINGKLSGHNTGVTVGKTVWNRVKSTSSWVYTRVMISSTVLCGSDSVASTSVERRWFSGPSCMVGTRFQPSTG